MGAQRVMAAAPVAQTDARVPELAEAAARAATGRYGVNDLSRGAISRERHNGNELVGADGFEERAELLRHAFASTGTHTVAAHSI